MLSLTFARRPLYRLTFVAGVVTTCIVLISCVLWYQSRQFVEWQIKEHLRGLVRISAELFTGEELDQVRDESDTPKAVYRDLVERLYGIMLADNRIDSAYLMRRTDDPSALVFIADAEALLTFEEQDKSGDGTLDETERIPLPGEFYDATDVPMMQGPAFEGTVTDEDFVIDQWGRTISGYAPIFRSDGSVAGILGIDVQDRDYRELTERLFPSALLLLLLLLGLIGGFYVAFIFMERRRKLLEQLENERAGMLQLVMHEVGEPVTMLNWMLESLESKPTEAELREQLPHMKTATAWLQRIYNALLRADRAGKTAARDGHPSKPTPLRTVLKELHAQVAPELAERSQELQMRIEDDPSVAVDRELIMGVLRELIANASAFSPQGASIRLQVELRGRHWVQIEVSDKGCGIPRKDLQRIFQRFTRGSNAARMKPVGTGLGLFVVHEVVTRARGRISVSSREGKGTTVTVVLPRG